MLTRQTVRLLESEAERYQKKHRRTRFRVEEDGAVYVVTISVAGDVTVTAPGAAGSNRPMGNNRPSNMRIKIKPGWSA